MKMIDEDDEAGEEKTKKKDTKEEAAKKKDSKEEESKKKSSKEKESKRTDSLEKEDDHNGVGSGGASDAESGDEVCIV